MKNDVEMCLCGGSFLTLLLNAKVDQITDGEGQKKDLEEHEVFRRLISIYRLSDFVPDAEDNHRSYTSKYKTCALSLPKHIGTQNSLYKQNFDADVKNADSLALQMMCAFVNDCLAEGSEDYLVSSLLDLIEQDDSILPSQAFYISADGVSTTKDALLSQKTFHLASFLLGVWHFILIGKANNTRCKDSYKDWVSRLQNVEKRVTRGIEVIPMPDTLYRPEKRTDVPVTKTTLSTIPLLQPETHYLVLTLSDYFKDDKEEDTLRFSISVSLDHLTQNDDPSIKAKFISQSDEMAKQLESLPCLFSDCGDYSKIDVPYYLEDFCPADDIVFSLGHIKNIICAKGNDYIRFRGELQIEKQFYQKELFLPAPHPYIEIGLSNHHLFYSPGLTVVEGTLIAGLKKLGVRMLDE